MENPTRRFRLKGAPGSRRTSARLGTGLWDTWTGNAAAFSPGDNSSSGEIKITFCESASVLRDPTNSPEETLGQLGLLLGTGMSSVSAAIPSSTALTPHLPRRAPQFLRGISGLTHRGHLIYAAHSCWNMAKAHLTAPGTSHLQTPQAGRAGGAGH